MGKYPYASTSDRTELQWLNSGYVIKRGRKGVEKYTSGTSQHTAIYYGESDVRKDEERAAAILEKRHQAKLLQQRKARAAEKKYHDTIKKEWQKYLRKVKKIVVFDTETSGLNAGAIPGWSLSALMEMLPSRLYYHGEEYFMEVFRTPKGEWVVQYPRQQFLFPIVCHQESFESPVEAVVKMICYLQEELNDHDFTDKRPE